MKKHFIFSLLLLITAFGFASANNDSPFVRFPTINSNGTTIAFSYQGDIWTVPANGGRAYRITIHEAYETNPVFSPNGKEIAFSSNRFGNNDIFIIKSTGGIPKRITYNSASDLISDWHKDNLFFESARNFRQVEWEKEILKVSASDGTPVRYLNSLGFEPVVSPDGKFIAFVKGECRVARERYQGSANKDIWLYNVQEKTYKRITSFKGQDFHPAWDSNNTLFYISAKNGRYNIYSVQIDKNGNTKPEKQITNFKDNPILWISVSKNSNLIVFEKGTDIFTVFGDGKNVKKINIQIDTDYRFDPVTRKTYSNKATDYAVSPNGKLIAFVVHGEVFVKQNKDKKPLSVNLSKSPYRDQDVAWLNDESLIFSSDRDGKFDLYLVKSSDENEKNIFKSLKHQIIKITNSNEEETNPVISKDGKKIVFLRGNGTLISADINKDGKITNEIKLLNGWATPSGMVFSPDNKWIAYTLEDLNFNAEVYIQPVDNSIKPVNVSMHPRMDYAPFFSPDGSKLGFISKRHNSDNDIWFVWLNKQDWQKTKQDWDEEEDIVKKPEKKGKTDKKDAKEKEEKVKPIKIDLDRIYERVVQVTNLPGDEGGLAISKDGKTFFFTTQNPSSKGYDLFSIKWDGTKMKQITKGGKNPTAISLGSKGKSVYFLTTGKIAKVDTKSGKYSSLPFKAKMVVNYNKELEQMFDEAWRTLRDNFYDPNFHSQNFKKLRDKYKPMCLKASTKQDFRDMFNIMLGQLNASHMGLYGGGRESVQKEYTGKLGIRIKPLKQGVEVVHVIANSPADKEASKLHQGDIILTVNGEKADENTNFWSLLTDTANTKVLLTVKGKNKKIREVIIRPATSLREELYNEWVETKRKLTDKYSNGKLGYLHIQGMSMPSFERFERELASAGHNKEGIVIDVRYNGGGWTTDYLMAILNVKQHAYTIPRGAAKSLKEHKKFREYYPFAERLPFYAWNKPSIAMCNSASYSNAEIFSHAYKTLKIGTLVGEPTFGAVISTGGKSLIDGMFVRKPFRAWYVKATDENMEWKPAVPDIVLENAPDSKAKGIDEQLKKACEVLLKQINNKKE
jgi:C-terminal processing protease CtpA/Prc